MVKTSWTDLEVYGRRNNKIIKYMETLLFKVKKDDPDSIVHYATAIANLTRQQLEIIKMKDNYDSIFAWFATIQQDKTAIKKHNLRQMEKNTQEDKLNMQHEIEEEKSVRRQMKTRDKRL